MFRVVPLSALALALMLTPVGIGTAAAQGQYPVMERMAQQIVQRYQSSSCRDLAAQKANPPEGQQAQMQQRVIQMLKQDPAMRRAFLNIVAAPIADKMLACGFIP